MTAKPVHPRVAAQQDIEAAITHNIAQAGAEVALASIDAVEAAFPRVGTHLGVGSPRISLELRVDGLCAWPPRQA